MRLLKADAVLVARRKSIASHLRHYRVQHENRVTRTDRIDRIWFANETRRNESRRISEATGVAEQDNPTLV